MAVRLARFAKPGEGLFYRAARLHKTLELLDYVSAPGLLAKEERIKRKQLIRRRAVAKTLAPFYRRLYNALPSTAEIYDKAYSLAELGYSKNAIAAQLQAWLNASLSAVDKSVTLEQLRNIAAAAIEEYADAEELPAAERGKCLYMADAITAESNESLAKIQSSTAKFVALAAIGALGLINLSRREKIQHMEERIERTKLSRARQGVYHESRRIEGHARGYIIREAYDLRRLMTMDDDRVCDTCIEDAARGWIPVGQPYPSGAMMPPDQHINCRCWEVGRHVPREVSEV